MNNYRQKYLKTYFWQIISVALGFASLFIVIPSLSFDKEIFGIYSVCTSLTIFFSYADLGFLASGTKYAAEYYIQGKHNDEVRIIGFTAFIMVIVFLILGLGVAILGIFPKLLIPELVEGTSKYAISRALLLTLAISCPIIIGQRILGLIFTIRVEDYKFQRFSILGNVLRICSVFYFLHGERYMIVEYFIFYQAVSLMIVISAMIYARKYGYNIREVLLAFRFDNEVFDKMKKLSGTALVLALSMIIYYELDQVVISHTLGVKAVATYSAALSVLTLVRTFCAIVYAPYASRYNHFVGLKDIDGLVGFVNKMIVMFAPIVVIPILTLSIFAYPFVVSWIGNKYEDSSILVSFMVLSFISNFVKDPISGYFVAREKNEILVKYNLLMPTVYWVGIILTIHYLGLLSLASFKCIAPLVPAVAYWFIVRKEFSSLNYEFVRFSEVLKTLLPAMIVIFFLSYSLYPYMKFEKGIECMAYNMIIMALCMTSGLLSVIPFNKYYRIEFSRLYNKVHG